MKLLLEFIFHRYMNSLTVLLGREPVWFRGVGLSKIVYHLEFVRKIIFISNNCQSQSKAERKQLL